MRHYPTAALDQVPARLRPAFDPASQAELAEANKIRDPFLIPGDARPYMNDVVRAMRLLKGARSYIEVGTYDKGCLAYVASLLHPEAIIVDVDIDDRPEQTQKLRSVLRPAQRLITIVGDSQSPETLAHAHEAVGGTADAVFIDGNHTAPYAWADYSNFGRVVSSDGLLLFHDIFWQGDNESFGSGLAMEWIDRLEPVYAILADAPVHRYFPYLVKSETVWGGIGVIPRSR